MDLKSIDELWKLVAGQFQSSAYSVHGPDHWRRVEFGLLHYACNWHTDELHHSDPTIGTCWDAVGRMGIAPDPAFMSTDFGREIAACGSIQPFIK